MMRPALIAIALASTSAAAAPSTFTLTSGEIRFEIEAPLDTIGGVSRGVSGSVEVDPAAWTTSPKATVNVDLTSFRTGIELRDEDLRDQFFETTKFTKATLTVNAIERASGTALVEGAAAEGVASGTLSLHGVERPVKIPLRVTMDPGGARVVVTGDFVVPILEHGIERPRRLIFKLGTDVKVSVRAVFRKKDAPAPAVAAADEPPPNSIPPPIVVARPVVEKPKPKWQFGENTPEGRGERAFVTAKIGGPKNALSCKSCHATADERKGLADGGVVRPSSSLWNAATRQTLWQGIAPSPGQAADICAKLFMLKDAGLDPKVREDIDFYLRKIAIDPQPALDFDAIHLSRRSGTIANLERGDAAKGKKNIEVNCKSCHAKGAVRPELEPGLYEAEMIVKRVRRAPGADNNQMPLFSITRLPDSELRDIVAYLVGDEGQRIFKRKKAAAAAAAAPAASTTK